MRSKREVVVLLPRKAREVEHDDELDRAFVCAAVVKELLKFRPVRCLGALAFFSEPREDFQALSLAVLLARLELR
jgi:hypothetical protein